MYSILHSGVVANVRLVMFILYVLYIILIIILARIEVLHKNSGRAKVTLRFSGKNFNGGMSLKTSNSMKNANSYS